MSRYKVLLFDLDGTLMDTAPGIIVTVKETLDKLGIAVPDRLERFLGPPLFRSMKDFCGLDDDTAWQAVRLYRSEYPKEQLFNSKYFDGVEDMLKSLEKQGFTLAVATSKPQPFARSLLERFGLDKYFRFIGGSGVDGARDSKQLVIEYVLDELGHPDKSTVLMIGDRQHDISGAKACGIDSIYVLWGYGSRDEAEACGAPATAASPADCLAYINEHK
ncbi:HAD-IA family hydrolase [Ruminococcus sp.]|uniref:HAD-IA family hydrolase n=1 Tax=Ruminococcus sp. TaxID=41978 RepID=UPI0025CEE88D|nr:HAD-IA family hydrolase [Ruminococcus sp.]MBQ8966522.1 HAD-IA family hydrolase [Ruminococcus sp.]